MKKTIIEVTSKVCKSCNTELPIENYRLHKSGYRLGKCYECEKKFWKIRRKHSEPVTLSITTKSGNVFVGSTVPINGGKKITSSFSDKVMYVSPSITRDQARSMFEIYGDVKRNQISVKSV
jgi:hypothetical protein